jgi:FkbM family methyltransferase
MNLEQGPEYFPKIRLFRNRPNLVAKFLLSENKSSADPAITLYTFPSKLEIENREPINARLGSRLRLAEWWLQPWIRPRGRTFIDIGANVGTWCKTLAPFFDKVHAVEPNPDALVELEMKLPSKVTVHRVGAWNRKQSVSFTKSSRSARMTAHFKAAGTNADPSCVTVHLPCRTIDSLEIDDDVDFIKCDAAGAEVECLKGAKKTILRDRPWILVEVHSSENFARLVPLLLKWGYSFTIVRDPHCEPFSKHWHEHLWLSCQPRSADDVSTGSRQSSICDGIRGKRSPRNKR